MPASKEILLPIKLVFTVVFMAIAYIVPSIWFAAVLDTRVAGLEISKKQGANYIERIAKNEGEIIGIKTDLSGVKTMINRIDKNVQKIADKLYESKRSTNSSTFNNTASGRLRVANAGAK